MEHRKTEALVLKSTPYLEKDFITVFLTKDFGKKTGRLHGARSIRSPYRGLAEPFVRLSLGYMEKESSGMVSIRSADLLEGHRKLRKQYNAFLYASYFSELLLECVIPENESLSFFALLNEALIKLNAGEGINLEQEHAATCLEFELNLLHLLGVYPQLERCVECSRQIWDGESGRPVLKRKGAHLFDVMQGGLCCHECCRGQAEVIQLQPGSLFFLIQRNSSKMESSSADILPTRANLVELEVLTCACLRQHIRRFPKSHKLLRKK